MLMKFSFCTATYLLLEFSDYKYYRKPNFLSGYNRVTILMYLQIQLQRSVTLNSKGT